MAQVKAKTMPAQLPAPLGRAMTRTPTKPAETAIQRSRPTRSLRIGQESAVKNSGAAKVSATASARGNRW
jgi:hypothetical protein